MNYERKRLKYGKVSSQFQVEVGPYCVKGGSIGERQIATRSKDPLTECTLVEGRVFGVIICQVEQD